MDREHIGQADELRECAAAEGQERSAGGVPEHWVRRVAVIWAGQALSVLSTVAASFAAVWYITTQTGSPLVLSLAGIATLLPVGLLSPLGGVAADRFSRKRLMMLADGAAGLCSLTLAAIVFLSGASIPLLLALLALRAAAQAFHSPALAAAMPQLVPQEQVMRVNALDQCVTSVSGIAGPALGILLYNLFGFCAVLLLDAACAAFACLCLALVSFPAAARSEQAAPGVRGVLLDLRGGLQLVFGDRSLRTLMLLVTASMLLFMPLAVLSPMMTYEVFNGSGYQASLVEAVYGAALLAGSAVVMVWGGAGKRKAPLIVGAGIVMGAALMACGFLREGMFPAYVALIGVTAAMVGVYNSPILPLVLARVPQEGSGRAMSMFLTVSSLASPVGLALSGAVTEQLGVPLWFAICGGLLLLVHLLAWALPSVRALDAETGA